MHRVVREEQAVRARPPKVHLGPAAPGDREHPPVRIHTYGRHASLDELCLCPPGSTSDVDHSVSGFDLQQVVGQRAQFLCTRYTVGGIEQCDEMIRRVLLLDYWLPSAMLPVGAATVPLTSLASPSSFAPRRQDCPWRPSAP
ncbi:hypothetical protein GCM10010308_51350 [Streptomyces vinaceusdrappus]|nr:hypothetical protein GCM10010301_53190 [Streptomyces plicatus]GHC27975.1 hypothetical protein GCM10010308_51350 [Streptomyces vinaceusdrappus]